MGVDADVVPGGARLWRSPAVVALTASVTVSQVGTQVTLLALPFVALVELRAGALVVGLLTAAAYLPWVLFALPTGAYVDGLDAAAQRRALIGCDLLRAALLAAVPVLAATGRLTAASLLGLVLVIGCATVLAEVAAAALVPRVVEAPLLPRVNGLIEGGGALAMVVGPALGGALVASVGAAAALSADAVSFAASALLLLRLPTRAGAPVAPVVPVQAGAGRGDVLLGGLRFLRRDPVLAPLCLWSVTSNLASNAITPAVLTYLIRDVRLTSEALGAVFAVAALGGLAGALVSARLVARLGLGRFVAASAVVLAVGVLGVGAVALPPAIGAVAVAWWVGVAYAVTLAGNVSGNAQIATIRQHRVPQGQLGRVIAAWRFLGFAGIPIGAVLGGGLTEALGPRPVLVGACVAFALTCLLPLTAPVRRFTLP